MNDFPKHSDLGHYILYVDDDTETISDPNTITIQEKQAGFKTIECSLGKKQNF